MATMVPELPPIERAGPHSENDFWRALRDELPDEFYVVYGLPFLTGDAVQGEVDFLVLHRELGMLNVDILVDVDPEDEQCTADHRYVAASRAKLRLHVFEKRNWMEVDDG